MQKHQESAEEKSARALADAISEAASHATSDSSDAKDAKQVKKTNDDDASDLLAKLKDWDSSNDALFKMEQERLTRLMVQANKSIEVPKSSNQTANTQQQSVIQQMLSKKVVSADDFDSVSTEKVEESVVKNVTNATAPVKQQKVNATANATETKKAAPVQNKTSTVNPQKNITAVNKNSTAINMTLSQQVNETKHANLTNATVKAPPKSAPASNQTLTQHHNVTEAVTATPAKSKAPVNTNTTKATEPAINKPAVLKNAALKESRAVVKALEKINIDPHW